MVYMKSSHFLFLYKPTQIEDFSVLPLAVWYGQADIATVIDETGSAEQNDIRGPPNMFDEDPNTILHSGPAFQGKPKSIEIQFKVSPKFDPK